MTEDIEQAMKKVVEELSSMSKEDFDKMLDEHKSGEISYFLTGSNNEE